MNNEEWETTEPTKELSVKDITTAIEDLRSADNKAKEQKKLMDLLNADVAELKSKVIAMLKETGLTSFKVPGVATVSTVEKFSVKTPKTHEEKEQFFAWLKGQGEDMYLTYASVNSASLNSLFKLKQEELAAQGEVLDIPGLEAPSSYTTLSLKK